MACADFDMDIIGHEDPRREEQRELLCVRYEALELVPQKKGPLHDLLQKQPAVLGSVQVVSGLFSVVVGFLFAINQEMTESFFTLFRVSHMTGALFIFAGIVSNLLFKFPGLVTVSFIINSGCIVAALPAAALISVDLSQWKSDNQAYLKIEMLVLCILGLEVLLSVVLCIWFYREKHTKLP